jgi:hypothetical protein
MSLVAHLLSGLINVGNAQCLDDEMDLCMDLDNATTYANPATSANPSSPTVFQEAVTSADTTSFSHRCSFHIKPVIAEQDVLEQLVQWSLAQAYEVGESSVLVEAKPVFEQSSSWHQSGGWNINFEVSCSRDRATEIEGISRDMISPEFRAVLSAKMEEEGISSAGAGSLMIYRFEQEVRAAEAYSSGARVMTADRSIILILALLFAGSCNAHHSKPNQICKSRKTVRNPARICTDEKDISR